jgi:citrate lyase subunit beta / citryl-CoA lyase
VIPFSLGPALLFCPADRPERFAKAAERADAVILDLEDAVAPSDKQRAREAVRASGLDPLTTIVRINALGSAEAGADLEMLASSPFRLVMVAKAESAEAIASLDARFTVIVLCETARGVLAAEHLAASPRVSALMWGAEDLVASLGGTSSRRSDGGYRDVARSARSRVLLAAGAYGKGAVDAVHVDIPDLEGLATEATDAAASGFTATACIHPSQVATIRAAYRPDPAALDEARRMLSAAESEGGVFRFEGRMVDEPVLRHARTLVARASAPDHAG